MKTRTIDDLLSEGHNRVTPLQRLLKNATNRKQWTAELRAVLDTDLRLDVQVTDIRGNTAFITCSHAAAATRLRFVLPEILAQLKQLQSFSGVSECKIRVSAR